MGGVSLEDIIILFMILAFISLPLMLIKISDGGFIYGRRSQAKHKKPD